MSESPIVTIDGLFETHLTVRDLNRSITFCRDVLGLPLATRIPERKAAFFWVPSYGSAMLGLWEIRTFPNFMRLPVAFSVTLEELESAIPRIAARGFTAFDGVGMTEPLVFAWMLAAEVGLFDPDGHSIELLAMLPDRPQPELGRVPLSEWRTLAVDAR